MKPILKRFGLTVAAVCMTHSLAAQEIASVLKQAITERIQLPAVFSTRDSLFALSLPDSTEGPAEVYIQLTVGRNGQVKEKKTRVNANHVGAYVAPAFIAAAKGMRIDRDSVPALTGRDTAVLLTFSLEYRCVLDTISTKTFGGNDWIQQVSKQLNANSYHNSYHPLTMDEIDKEMHDKVRSAVSTAEYYTNKAEPTTIWYYLAFLKSYE